jgi:hypothetical protein
MNFKTIDNSDRIIKLFKIFVKIGLKLDVLNNFQFSYKIL